jgi:NADH-quinone oxidoreductase subunit G
LKQAGKKHPQKIAALSGDMACMESMFALRELFGLLGSPNLDCRQDGAKLDYNNRSSYIFNSKIENIENADLILLVGTNPRHEATMINARIRKSWLGGKLKIYAIGEEADLTYKTNWLGNNPSLLTEIASGKHELSELIKNAKNPMIIIGQGALSRKDGGEILKAAQYIADNFGVIKDDWNGFNVMHTAAARVGGLDVGFVPQAGGKDVSEILEATSKNEMEVVYLLGSDEIDISKLGNSFVIYQGTHGDKGAHRADVILPSAAYTEKSASYTNTEGLLQKTQQAVFAPGEAKEDWKIIRSLSEVLGKTLPFDNLQSLRAKMPVISETKWQANKGSIGTISSQAFEYPIKNYYMTDAISRASKTMAECVSVLVDAKVKKTAA